MRDRKLPASSNRHEPESDTEGCADAGRRAGGDKRHATDHNREAVSKQRLFAGASARNGAMGARSYAPCCNVARMAELLFLWQCSSDLRKSESPRLRSGSPVSSSPSQN